MNATPAPALWRYIVPSRNGLEGWGIFVLASDGYFSCVTDFGNYAYQWTAIGEGRDFRDFLLQIGPDYLIGKIAPEQTYDASLTETNVRELIEKQLQAGLIDAATRQAELDLLERQSDLENEFYFYTWLQETELTVEPSEVHETSHSRQAIVFCDELFPRFKELLRAALTKERADATTLRP